MSKQKQEKPAIFIRIEGGLVQSVGVRGIPGPIHLDIRDYDTDGCAPAELRVDPDGEEYRPHYPNIDEWTPLWMKPGRRAQKWIPDPKHKGLYSKPPYPKLTE